MAPRLLNKARSNQCGIIVLDLWNLMELLSMGELFDFSWIITDFSVFSCNSSITSPSCQQITSGLIAFTSWLINLLSFEQWVPIPIDSTLTKYFLLIVIPYLASFDCDEIPSNTVTTGSDSFKTEESICFTKLLRPVYFQASHVLLYLLRMVPAECYWDSASHYQSGNHVDALHLHLHQVGERRVPRTPLYLLAYCSTLLCTLGSLLLPQPSLHQERVHRAARLANVHHDNHHRFLRYRYCHARTTT